MSSNPETTAPSSGSQDRLERTVQRLEHALERLEEAKPFAKSVYQTDVFQLADTLLGSEEGLAALYARAGRLHPAGLFHGGAWADPAKLLPPLVRGSIEASGIYAVVECLSELRMLAIAQGTGQNERVTPALARAFLEEVMALNLDLVFPVETEESRGRGPAHAKAERVFQLIARELTLDNLLNVVADEIEAVCLQRPIMTQRVVNMIRMVDRIPRSAFSEGDHVKLEVYLAAVNGPSELSRRHPQAADYRRALQDLDAEALTAEAEAFGEALRATGLGSGHHAILLRRLRSTAPELLGKALGLNALGLAELDQNRPLAHQLIKVAILPATAQSVYGLARVLERGLLSRSEVAAGLRRLVDLDLCSQVRKNLLSKRGPKDGVTANSILLGGAISVLGQPLGIGQGRNPTCQAARGISLWSQHAPGYLLELVASAARDDLVQLRFENHVLNSNELGGGLAKDVDLELDPVSIVLVPHLDRLYDEIMRRVALRDEDGHKWANPALYGRWVPHGFCSVLDKLSGVVQDYAHFVRRFYATHHPAYNDGYELIYPNPVGLFITNTHGALLGLHAVSLQRIKEDDEGTLRAYFFNPNNEGRQDWGQGIVPSIAAHGELEGESSLPFWEFAARLYAFHYNPFEEGDAFAVPEETIHEVAALARESWGASYPWA